MMQLNKGDLFYVPSGAVMIGKNKIKKLDKPAVMINLSDKEEFYETYFDGSKYLINKKNAFPLQQGVKYDA